MADEITLDFLARQLERVLSEQRATRAELAALPSIRDELGLIRGEIQLLREQVRTMGLAIARLEDTIRMDVLERIRRLEDSPP